MSDSHEVSTGSPHPMCDHSVLNRNTPDGEEERFDVLYADTTATQTVQQSTLDYQPPQGLRGSLYLIPVVAPKRVRLKPTPWAVDGWFRAGGVALLSGRYKSHKSYVARQVAISVVTGRPFLGLHAVSDDIKGRPVIFICAEEKVSDLLYAFERAAEGLYLDMQELSVIKVWPAVGVELFEKQRSNSSVKPTQAFHELEHACKNLIPGLIIVDTLVAVKGDANENVADDIRPVFTCLRRLGRSVDATVLVVDHEGFDTPRGTEPSQPKRRTRGSSDKLGAVDDHISLSVDSKAGSKGQERYQINARFMHRGAGAGEEEFSVVFTDPDGPIEFVGSGAMPTATSISEEGKELLQAIQNGHGSSKRKLQEALGLESPSALTKRLKRYERLVLIKSEGRGKADAIRLSPEGERLAREVLNEAGAQGAAA